MYPFVNSKGVATAPHSLQRIASLPILSICVGGFSAPQLGQTALTKASPINLPSTGLSLPEAVTSEVTSRDSTLIKIASPLLLLLHIQV